MDFLSNLVPYIASIASFLVTDTIGILFLGIGIFGFVLSMFRKLI